MTARDIIVRMRWLALPVWYAGTVILWLRDMAAHGIIWPLWLVLLAFSLGSWLFIAAVASAVMKLTGAC